MLGFAVCKMARSGLRRTLVQPGPTPSALRGPGARGDLVSTPLARWREWARGGGSRPAWRWTAGGAETIRGIHAP